VPIHPNLDKLVLDTFDKLEALTSTLISNIDDAYLQHLVELAALTISTSELSTESSNIVNTPSFTTTSPIISTTIHSPKPLIPQFPLQSSISSSSSSSPTISSLSSSKNNFPPSQTKISIMEDNYSPLVLLAQLHAMPQAYHSKIFLFDATGHILTNNV